LTGRCWGSGRRGASRGERKTCEPLRALGGLVASAWLVLHIGGTPPARAQAPAPTPGEVARQAPAQAPPPQAAEEAADPDAPTVAAHVEPTQAHVGDPVQLTITAIARKGVPVNLPNVVELGNFSLLDRAESQTDLGDGRTRRQFVLRVAAYEPGTATLPAVDVTYLGRGGSVRQVRTMPQTVTIASLIANEPEPALKENSGPVPVFKQDLRLVYVAGALLAAALGGLVTWLVVRRLRRRVHVRPGPPPRPAHEIAMERLDRLGSYGFLENADNRPFYFSVSEIIRDYLGARFGFDSLELTTHELMAELKKRASRQLVMGEIKGWLSACDLVKFAKVSPSAAEARGTLEEAIRIVESTRPRIALPASTGDGNGDPVDPPGLATAASTLPTASEPISSRRTRGDQ
jgi:BatD DUF11 like domain